MFAEIYTMFSKFLKIYEIYVIFTIIGNDIEKILPFDFKNRGKIPANEWSVMFLLGEKRMPTEDFSFLYSNVQ